MYPSNGPMSAALRTAAENVRFCVVAFLVTDAVSSTVVSVSGRVTVPSAAMTSPFAEVHVTGRPWELPGRVRLPRTSSMFVTVRAERALATAAPSSGVLISPCTCVALRAPSYRRKSRMLPASSLSGV